MNNEDICGICGQPGADKMALWTGGGKYWPGEFIPESELVHSECEKSEQQRAFYSLTEEERRRYLNSI